MMRALGKVAGNLTMAFLRPIGAGARLVLARVLLTSTFFDCGWAVFGYGAAEKRALKGLGVYCLIHTKSKHH